MKESETVELKKKLFRRIDMVEAWGRGMPLILKNEPDVKFREVAGIFIVSFDRPSFGAGEAMSVAMAVETPKETPKETPNSTAARIMEIVARNPTARLSEMSVEIGKSLSAVHRASMKLAKDGRLRHVGSTKARHWEVLK